MVLWLVLLFLLTPQYSAALKSTRSVIQSTIDPDVFMGYENGGATLKSGLRSPNGGEVEVLTFYTNLQEFF